MQNVRVAFGNIIRQVFILAIQSVLHLLPQILQHKVRRLSCSFTVQHGRNILLAPLRENSVSSAEQSVRWIIRESVRVKKHIHEHAHSFLVRQGQFQLLTVDVTNDFHDSNLYFHH